MSASSDARSRATRRVTVAGALVNVALTAVKLFAGVASGSSAMIADAVHSLSDLVGDGVVLVSMRVGSKPADDDHPYGHGRFETLGTVGIGLLLLGVAVGIALNAWERGASPAVPGAIALWAALISIASKEALYRVTLNVGKKHGSRLVQANAHHHRSDALSSVAALIGIGGALLGFPILDPIAAIVVAVLIGKTAVLFLTDAAREMTDTAISEEELKPFRERIAQVSGVVSIHRLRARRMGQNLLVDVHVQVDGTTSVSDGHQVSLRVERCIRERFDEVTEVLVHIDPEADEVEERLSRPGDVLEREVREAALVVEGVTAVSHVLLHFLAHRVTVSVHIEVDAQIRVTDATVIARQVRRRVDGLRGVDHVDVHLELDDGAHGAHTRPGRG